ncbi:acyl-CoA dehydrogenase family protein [Nocardioides humi]|uniref:Acyl-CoA dehydrogenase family protein n=1 Tax=Nocardioides humi TaxID=449461 RepID=A0ABN2B3T1_9ACTN|nr:acyl-CoA dehydrogenase family protein [Nocardioides humi]
MDLHDTEAEAGLRAKVRDWLSTHVPASLRSGMSIAERADLDRVLAGGGYLGLTWPRVHGGAGLSAVEASVFDEEAARLGIDLSRSPSRLGLNMMGPAMMAHGTREQQQRFLPPVLGVEQLWCQGFSEPDAGSDLAAVRTLAVRDGDGYRVNGTKIWTTQAHVADLCLLLVRTEPDAPRHHNLSMLLLDMHQPGVTVSPIRDLAGEHEFNEVHLDGALVPRENLLGEPGGGWKVAMTTLTSERSYALRGKYVVFHRQLRRIGSLLAEHGGASRPSWVQRLGDLSADVHSVRNLSYRAVSLVASGRSAGSIAPVAHLWTGQTHQRLVEFGFEVSSVLGVDTDYWYRLWLETRAETIYGGAAQVQRNMIAERILALPR